MHPWWRRAWDLYESIPSAPGPQGLLSIQVKIYKTMVYETPTLNYQELLAHNGPWTGGLGENAHVSTFSTANPP